MCFRLLIDHQIPRNPSKGGFLFVQKSVVAFLKKILRLGIYIYLGFIIYSCTSLRMYPIEGPYSQVTPLPIIKANASGIMGNNGKLRFSLPDGAACSGEWVSAAGSGIGYSSGSLISQYGTTYFSGMNISSGHGQNPGQAFAVCDDGRRFEFEFVTGSGTASGFGIARDTEGNIFKCLF
ncbi:MAG: hypothetical protein IT286_04920 [Proteobacteria bacterium]|jgi:hypothetical protein|nr:hypothetical protein [Pseudomonadota bacterium]